jgi:hypothetical protein
LTLLHCAFEAAAAKEKQDGKASAAGAEASTLPSYPRVNLAPAYKIVPNWARVPAGAKKAAVPSIIVDNSGNIWAHVRSNPAVQVFSPDGRFIKGWEAESPRAVPHGIGFDPGGNVWLVDAGLHTVSKFSPQGARLQTLGVAGEAGADEKHFNSPTGIAFTPDGNIFISDGYGNSRVVHYDSDGRYVKAWGKLGVAPGEFSIPHAIASDSKGRLYVADRNNVRIQVYDQEGTLLDSWQNIVVPWTFHMNAKDELWVCGSSPMQWSVDAKYPTAPLGCPPKDQVLVKFNTSGRVLEVHTFPKGEDDREKPGDLNWFHGIALDRDENLYAGDIIGKRLQKFERIKE